MNNNSKKSDNTQSNKNLPETPLVSIVTPVLNRVKYVEESILNLLHQTYKNIEHIFADGGSTDGTVDILAKYHAKFPEQIKYISGKDNGLGDAVNKGWKMAKGEILGWIDVGDTYKPDAVEAIIAGFKSSGADIVFGGGDMINAKDEFMRTYITNDFNLRETIRDRNQMHTPPSAFYRSYVIRELGWVTPNSGETIELHIAAGKKYKIHRIDKLVFTIRLQQDSITYSKSGRKLVRESFRTGYLTCRKYGGGIFAPKCRRYYIFVVLDTLRIYDFVVLVVLVRLRRYVWVNKLLSKMGLLTN